MKLNLAFYVKLIPLVTLPSLVAADQNNDEPWQKIDVANEMTISDKFAGDRTIHPACAFSYTSPAQSNFHFYFKPGKKDRLLVFFNEGGACWDDKTCVSSLKLGSRPTYNPILDSEYNLPEKAGGLFDTNNAQNPFKDWSMVFIPYCTGDVHIGSKDQVYADVDGVLTGQVNAPVLVQHRGFDNMMAVREWIKNESDGKKRKIVISNGNGSKSKKSVSKQLNKKTKVEQLLVTGSSAGSYGAKLNFPYLRSLFPTKTRTYLLADSGTAVMDQRFVDKVLVEGGSWNAENTWPKQVPGFEQFGNFNATNFNVKVIQDLANAYPKTRIAEYTRAWDAVQVLFYSVMKSSGDSNVAGLPWTEIPAAESFLYWNNQTVANLNQIDSANFRYYIGKGIEHIALTNEFSVEKNAFYAESSAQNLLFTDWLKQFTAKTTKSWKSVSCESDSCGRPF